MSPLQRNLPIVLAVVLSALLHVFVLFPAIGILGLGSARDADGLVRSGLAPDEGAEDGASEEEDGDEAERRREEERRRSQSEIARRAMQERLARDRERPPEEREEKVHLGIDRSNAVTMNWIGYDEYEEHLAERAEFEQAAFRLRVASGSEGSESPLLPPAPPAPTPAASPDPSPLPIPAAVASASGSPGSGPAPSIDTSIALARPTTPPVEGAERRGDDDRFARPPLPPEMPAPPGGAPSDGASLPETDDNGSGPSDASTEIAPTERPDPAEPSTAPVETDPLRPSDGVRPVPPTADESPTDPDAPVPVDPLVRPSPSDEDPLERLDPATPGTTPEALPRETDAPTPEEDTAPVEPRETDGRPSDASSADANASTEGSEGDGAPADETAGGGIESPEPVDGAADAATKPAPAGAPGDTPAKPGELSDRESDATSIIDVPAALWRNGRPLAARGVVLKPVRPRFTALDYVDGIARNPIGELVLGRDGVPQVARLVRSSGNPRIDEAIRNALFKWRATGEPLEKLKPGQTVTIRLRLVMLQG